MINLHNSMVNDLHHILMTKTQFSLYRQIFVIGGHILHINHINKVNKFMSIFLNSIIKE